MMKSKLRLALLSVHSCPLGKLGSKDTGGMNVYVRELARNLGGMGHSVDIFTRLHDVNESEIIDIGENARLIHISAGEDTELDKLVLYSYLPEFVRNLENFRKQNDLCYDLIFSHYWLSGWTGQVLQQIWNIPDMLMFHTLGAIKNSLGIGEDESELRLEAEQYLAKNCDRIIASTEREKEIFKTQYGVLPENIAVIPCGVNLDLFKPANNKTARQQLNSGKSKVILFVGRIEAVKGIDLLVEAVSLMKNIPDTRLIIVGGDEQNQQEINRLKRLAKRLGVEDSVIFTGLIAQEKLPLYYSSADVCVVPSYYESFGMVALESLACGTPVISTRVGDMEHIIQEGKTGFILPDNTPFHIAEKTSALLSQFKSDEKTRQLIRASVAEYDWKIIADKVAIECRKLIDEHTARKIVKTS